MAGIPLTAGFVAKFTAFGAAIAGPDGQGGGSTWVLAVVGVLASAVAVFFYVRLIVLMFFTAPSGGERDAADGGADASEGTGVTVVRSTGPTTVAIAVCAIGVLLLGVFPPRFSIWRPRRLSSSRDLRASRPLRARRARGPRERTAPVTTTAIPISDPELAAALTERLAEVETRLRAAVAHADPLADTASRHLVNAGASACAPCSRCSLPSSGTGHGPRSRRRPSSSSSRTSRRSTTTTSWTPRPCGAVRRPRTRCGELRRDHGR